MVTVLSGTEIRPLLEMEAILDVVADAIVTQEAGAVERPDRPHYPVGVGLDADAPDRATGTGLVMPAYVHGAEYFATKLVSVHPGNPERGLPTTNAQLSLADAETGESVAYMDGNHVTGARTGSIGGLAARELTSGPIRVAVVGAGTQARWQVRAIDAATTVESVAITSRTKESRERTAADLEAELGIDVFPAADPDEVVTDADLVVTATTSPEPVFSGEALSPGTVVVGIGAYTEDLQELDPETFARASQVFADVPEEVATIGDIRHSGLDESDLVPFAALLSGDVERPESDDIVVVESVGSAVMDAATATYVYEQAVESDAGTGVSLD